MFVSAHLRERADSGSVDTERVVGRHTLEPTIKFVWTDEPLEPFGEVFHHSLGELV